MTKKTMIFAAALTLGASMFAATPAEMLNSGDYYGFAKLLNYDNKYSDLVIPTNAKAIYDVAMASNMVDKAEIIAAFSYAKGDKTLFYSFLETLPTKTEYLNSVPRCGINIWAFTAVGVEGAKITGVNAYGKEVTKRISYLMIEPERMLAFCKAAKACGQLNLASVAFWQTSHPINTTAKTFNSHITPEWKEFFDSFTAEDIAKFKYWGSLQYAYLYFKKLDYINGDAEETELTKRWSANTFKKFCTEIGCVNTPKYKKISCEIILENAKKVSSRIKAAKILDDIAKDKKASASIFSYVLENGTFSEAATLAFYLKDNDKIIDAYKKIGTTATAAEVDALIPVVNALDYNYRAAEVADILKNINSKYTLKLYDDRDTWEPILSKIRAMIDARM